ncbi:MAG: hypothetical protein K0S26_511 [Bacteroidota bacterium]|jgi:hypothetical protein|nr:hypothetical protein [Bacteroidota bacterium]
MGFEHQVYFSLTNESKNDIRKLLIENSCFTKSVIVDNKEYFEFHKTNAGNDMPDFSVVIETDGLYVCNNRQPDAFADIEFITQYLSENNIKYSIEEL